MNECLVSPRLNTPRRPSWIGLFADRYLGSVSKAQDSTGEVMRLRSLRCNRRAIADSRNAESRRILFGIENPEIRCGTMCVSYCGTGRK
jgi:hypothetical protein